MRRERRAILAAAFAVIAAPRLCHADTLENPPLVPSSEGSLLPPRPFVTKTCLHALQVLRSEPGAVLGSPVLMHSPRWPPHQKWSIQIAIGQRIPPLER
jgi:hypothetical protein